MDVMLFGRYVLAYTRVSASRTRNPIITGILNVSRGSSKLEFNDRQLFAVSRCSALLAHCGTMMSCSLVIILLFRETLYASASVSASSF
jgi:hypothetical protein